MCVFKGTSKANAAAEMKRDRRNKRARDGGNGGFGAGDRDAARPNGIEDAVRVKFPRTFSHYFG
jgi:hypothetical protein